MRPTVAEVYLNESLREYLGKQLEKDTEKGPGASAIAAKS